MLKAFFIKAVFAKIVAIALFYLIYRNSHLQIGGVCICYSTNAPGNLSVFFHKDIFPYEIGNPLLSFITGILLRYR